MAAMLKLVGGFLAALAVATPVGAWVLANNFATEVLIITPRPTDEVRVNQGLWMAGDPVADIYGVPTDQKTLVLFADEARIIRPKEDPTLVLLAVDKQAGENPFQVRTLWFFAWRLAAGFAAGALALLGLGAWIRLRRRSP